MPELSSNTDAKKHTYFTIGQSKQFGFSPTLQRTAPQSTPLRTGMIKLGHFLFPFFPFNFLRVEFPKVKTVGRQGGEFRFKMRITTLLKCNRAKTTESLSQ